MINSAPSRVTPSMSSTLVKVTPPVSKLFVTVTGTGRSSLLPFLIVNLIGV